MVVWARMKPVLLVSALLLAGCGGEIAQDNSGDLNQVASAPTMANESNRSETVPPTAPAEKDGPGPSLGPCLLQDGQRVPANRIKAVGTEPFWAARIEGRCVTYLTPEDQQGTRIWTRFSGTADNGAWVGALDGRRFELITRPEPGCSDGMSDKRYPTAVMLAVRGEQRTGCAEPI